MKSLFFPVLCLTASQALADGPYSQSLAMLGPARAAEALAAQGALTPSDQFALGGFRFLKAIEGALQTRYAYGLDTLTLQMIGEIPFLRLPVAPNPNPKPFDPSTFERIFAEITDDLAMANTALDQVAHEDLVTVRIDIADIWFDINSNSQRDPGEGFLDVLAAFVAPGDSAQPMQNLTIQFDTADAAWLSAYAHALSGTSELIRALDPTAAISASFDGGANMDDVRGSGQLALGFVQESDLVSIDTIAAMIAAIEGQPDANRTRAAHQHFLDMIADNRVFWARLAAETDNTNEWIPNDRQSSALPLTFPSGIGTAWQAVLADVEDVLNGAQLLPYWRLGENAGLNLANILQDPPDIDIIGLFQGYSLAPYAETGPTISMESIMAFDDLTGGNSPLFMIMLN